MDAIEPERMECMEVWGGNQAVQRAFQTPGLKIWIESKPFGDAMGGGDVYYLSSCASGRITRMLLADVSGHGEMVSRTGIALRDLMRRNVNYIKQTRFVRAMNVQFAEVGDQGGFATALVGTFFAPTMSFALCNAGHPAPLIFRRGEAAWSPLRSEPSEASGLSDIPLGIAGKVAYGQIKINLHSGDMLLFFSDAITESQDAAGRQIGEEGVLRLVREMRSTDPNQVISSITERIKELRSSNLEQDDATLLLIQANGSRPSLSDNLFAPFRLLRGVAN